MRYSSQNQKSINKLHNILWIITLLIIIIDNSSGKITKTVIYLYKTVIILNKNTEEIMLQRRNSKQRNVIREYLCGRIDHPTAEKLYKEIRLEHPKMSLGTVYRNLMFLTDIGEIQALDVGDGITHFDPNPMPHAHFYCKKCKRVFDVFMDDYEKIQNIFANNVQGKVESCAVSLTGSCKECSENN